MNVFEEKEFSKLNCEVIRKWKSDDMEKVFWDANGLK